MVIMMNSFLMKRFLNIGFFSDHQIPEVDTTNVWDICPENSLFKPTSRILYRILVTTKMVLITEQLSKTLVIQQLYKQYE